MKEFETIDEQTQNIYEQKGRDKKAQEDYTKMIQEGISKEVAERIAFGD